MAPNDFRTANEVRSASDSSVDTTTLQKTGIPRIALNLRAHKKSIAIPFTILVFFSGIIPVALYYILAKGAKTSATVYVVVPSVIFGANSILPMIQRTVALTRKSSTVRPIGGSRWGLDYFQFNFITLFIALTVMISIGSSMAGSDNPEKPKQALRIVAMGVPVLMICVCMQAVIIYIGMSMNSMLRYPFRISSMAKGDIVRPALYTITEDVVAVDGKQGTEYRRQLSARYEFSEDIRALFKWADAVWGFSGVILGAGLIAVIWAVDTVEVGYTLGWIVPWIWAGTLTIATIQRTKSACRNEASRYVTA